MDESKKWSFLHGQDVDFRLILDMEGGELKFLSLMIKKIHE
ncbi:unnamed protein product [Coffea canephora]|uniref:Uncharacterized protein n=1 Tax=Coffea canephora TaxID=49390 RepID=A0A068UKH4_COFCA|nr:unnamed protein product [Coffea canephora]